ncbi:MAG: hypothetical protein NTX24_01070 [Candidatus Pacearchaeota archaeon]|nr:hypothetical protein [Candidatus Pacearchaeota archaeon]
MPRISKSKQDKIKEAILLLLFQNSPKPLFTAQISQELARDEEYVKKLLLEMETGSMILSVKKNPEGIDYKRRLRWNLSEKVYSVYKAAQDNPGSVSGPIQDSHIQAQIPAETPNQVESTTNLFKSEETEEFHKSE